MDSAVDCGGKQARGSDEQVLLPFREGEYEGKLLIGQARQP